MTPWTGALQASLSITISQSLLRFMSIESVMLSNYLILCHSLHLLPQSFPASGSFPMSQLFPSGGQSIGEASTLASLVAQMVKNPPAMWKTWVWSLGWEDPLEEGMATHSHILACRIPMDRGAWRAISMRSWRVGEDWVTKHSTVHSIHIALWFLKS